MKENSQQYWNCVASTWERFGDLNSHVEKQVASTLDKYVDYAKINLLLNLGSGSGDRYLSILGEKVVHLDYAHNMLIWNEKGNKVEANAGMCLPFASNSLDCATSFFLMRYLTLSEQISLINNALSLLKPGGILVIIDIPDNNHQFQVAKFDPEVIASQIPNCGLVLKSEIETKNVGKYISTGFGGWYEHGSYKISTLIVEKVYNT